MALMPTPPSLHPSAHTRTDWGSPVALETNSPAESGSISRRTIVKGAAWAAPVMIAAVAVPAAVASTPTSFIASPATIQKGQSTTINLTLAGFGTGSVTLTFVGKKNHGFHFITVDGPSSTSVDIIDDIGSVLVFAPSASGATVTLRASQSSPAWQLDQTLTDDSVIESAAHGPLYADLLCF